MNNNKEEKRQLVYTVSDYDDGSNSTHSLKESPVDFTVLHKLTEEHSKIIDNLIAELQETSNGTNQFNENNNLESKNILENEQVPKNELTVENNIIKENEDEEVYVILDAKNAVCGAFCKDVIIERFINDKSFVGVKANYSLKVLKTRAEGIMNLYNLTKEQTQRIDSFIYTTLCEYDDAIWIKKGIASNKAEDYVKCMSREYRKEEGESNTKFLIRCQTLRKQELAKKNITIDYRIKGLWTTLNLKPLDKIIINKFSNMYDITKNRKFIKKLFEHNNLKLLQEKF